MTRLAVPTGRVVGVDVARCLALVGMIATHVLVGIEPDGAVSLSHRIAAGRASALFAVLAGVSLALMSGGPTPPTDRRDRAAFTAGVVARALLVAAIGLVLGGLASGIAVILTYYGLLFVLATPFLWLRSRQLVVLAAAWVVVVPVLSQAVRASLPLTRGESPRFALLGDPLALVRELLLTGTYPVLPWLAYLLAGLAVGRLDLSRRVTAVYLAGAGAVLASLSGTVSDLLVLRASTFQALSGGVRPSDTGVEQLRLLLAFGFHGTTPTDTWWWLAVVSPHSGTPFDLAHTIGTSLLVLGLAVLVAGLAPRAFAVVFGAGAMTLTLYSVHVVLRTEDYLPRDTTGTFLTHVAIVLVVGAVFRLLTVRGPLEELSAVAARTASGLVRDRWPARM